MAESRLDVVINPNRAQAGARAVRGSIDSMKQSWVEFTAKAFLAEQAITRMWKVASGGADFEEGLSRLDTQMGRFHSRAQVMINDLKNVSNNQLSNAQAVQLASRAMMQGMNPDQIRVFTQAADLLGDVMGTDLNGAFETILQGLQTGRTQMLANIGVYVDLEKETKDLAVATNRTADQITKQEKAAIGANAVISQLGGTLDKFASGAVSDADRMKAIEVRFDDMTLAVGRFAKSLVIDAVDAWQKFSDFVNDPKRNPFRAAEQALRESTPGNINNPATQEILGRSIVADAQGNLARRAADPKPKAAQLDPKLRLIQLEGAHDRALQSIQASEGLLGEESERAMNDFKRRTDEFEKTLVELAQFEKKNAIERLTTHAQTITAQIAEETKFHAATIGLADTTEAKFSAEQKFQSKIAELMQERAATEEKIATARFAYNDKIRAEELKAEMAHGERLRDSFISTFQIEEDQRHRAQDTALAYYQNLAKFQEVYGTSRENMMTTEYDLVRANLAKQLDVTQETAEKILNAWRNSDHTRAEELLGLTKLTAEQQTAIYFEAMANQRAVSEKFSDDLFGGFAKSLQRYTKDQSMFGLGADQARSVAQAMEQGFRTYFFDAMEGRINSFKDVVQGLTDFAKNIVSDISSKLITRSILGGIDQIMSGGGIPSGGFNAAKLLGMDGFAGGGITHRPAIFGEAGPEAAVPLPDGRRIPVEMRMPYGVPAQMQSTNVSMPVTVNVHDETGSNVQAKTSMGSSGPQIDVYIKNVVNKGFRDGAFDLPMQQFGARRQPMRRG